MDFNITAEEQCLLFRIVEHLDAGSTPTLDELSTGAGPAPRGPFRGLRDKGWTLVREVDGQDTVVAVSPMAVRALSNLRFGRDGEG